MANIEISSVELTNTFDEWRQRTNDIITVANDATWDLSLIHI